MLMVMMVVVEVIMVVTMVTITTITVKDSNINGDFDESGGNDNGNN